MSAIEKIKAKAKANVKHIVLPEGTEPRTVQASAKILAEGIAKVTLIGNPEEVAKVAAETGAVLEFIEDPIAATKGADVIYTDVWVSMGEPDSVWQERIDELSPYRVTMELIKNAGSQCRFMHCLPAFHDLKTTIGKQIFDKFAIDCMEVTDEVFESEKSIVFDEAENRMHTIKAVMAATL